MLGAFVGGKTGEKSLFDKWSDTRRNIALTAYSAVRMIRAHENRGIAKTVDLRGLAARGVRIEGTVSPEDPPRLADSGIGIVESGSAAFDFRRDEEARYVVAVSVEARVVMQCQRCLSDMEVPVKSACHGMRVERRGGRGVASDV